MPGSGERTVRTIWECGFRGGLRCSTKGGLPVMETASDERLKSARSRQHHDVSGWVAGSVLCASLKARISWEPGVLRECGLKRGRQLTVVSSALAMHGRARARPRHGACLRSVFARSFGKAKISDCECFSSGATRRPGLTGRRSPRAHLSCFSRTTHTRYLSALPLHRC